MDLFITVAIVVLLSAIVLGSLRRGIDSLVSFVILASMAGFIVLRFSNQSPTENNSENVSIPLLFIILLASLLGIYLAFFLIKIAFQSFVDEEKKISQKRFENGEMNLISSKSEPSSLKRKIEFLEEENSKLKEKLKIAKASVQLGQVSSMVTVESEKMSIAQSEPTSFLEDFQKLGEEDSEKKSLSLYAEPNLLKVENLINAKLMLLEGRIESLLQESLVEVFSKIEDISGENTRNLTAHQLLRKEYERTRNRLNLEIASLNGRGKLNLFIGIFISIFGIMLLGWSLVNAPNVQADNRDLLAYYIPRTAFVIMFEIFAFFFLNLYRASLNDIKYFQNELTNIDLKIFSMEMLIFSEDMKSFSDLAMQIVKTERNFILRKGQTTVVLEKEKLEGSIVENISKIIGQILGKQNEV